MQMGWRHKAAGARLRLAAALALARPWECMEVRSARLQGRLWDTLQVRRAVTWRFRGLLAGRSCRDARALCAEPGGSAEAQALERGSLEAREGLERTFRTIPTCRDLDSMPCMWRRRVGTAEAAGETAGVGGTNPACCFLFLVEAGITCRPGRT